MLTSPRLASPHLVSSSFPPRLVSSLPSRVRARYRERTVCYDGVCEIARADRSRTRWQPVARPLASWWWYCIRVRGRRSRKRAEREEIRFLDANCPDRQCGPSGSRRGDGPSVKWVSYQHTYTHTHTQRYTVAEDERRSRAGVAAIFRNEFRIGRGLPAKSFEVETSAGRIWHNANVFPLLNRRAFCG